jgi:hypothetical protein
MNDPFPPELPSNQPKKTPGLAIASLVFGIISVIGGAILFVPMVLAIVFGHIAHARIRKNPTLGGGGIALAGLVLGYVSILTIFIVGLLAAMAIPAFQKVRENSLQKAMINDARMIATAAQQVMLEEGEKPVAFQIDPKTGTISGPISAYVTQVTKGTRAVDSVIESATDGFSLAHPHVRRGREMKFDAAGEPAQQSLR